MRILPNFNIDGLDSYPKALAAIDQQLVELISILAEEKTPLSEQDRLDLVTNIQWLKRFYEMAERSLLKNGQ